jgi:nucleoside-triphosphatase THEP1
MKVQSIRDNLGSMTSNQTMAPFAAAVYKPDTGDRMALLKFVEKQKALNTRVGGVLQEALYNSEGEIVGIDAVDVSTNQRIPISRPAKNDEECGLDVSALAGTTGIIRNAIDERLDLVVVEKFGELEQNGKGLIDEILQTIAEGIPLLIAVPEAALPAWQERSGELGSVLAFNQEAFQQWWQSLA